MFSLQGKVALVTGSTKGIGKSIAWHMAKAGAKVVISSRNVESCDEVTREFTAAGLTAIALPCNIAHKEELQKMVADTLAKWGRIDILVCNAATNPVYGPMAKASDDAFDKIMGTNVKTDFARALWEDDRIRTQREAQTPLRRLGEADDIGGIAVMLARRAGNFITGQMIVADGGVTIA
jgi:NAD(P)-dependent dehydrogenase (short-subunit alcohol dehydrogenase family)